MNWFFYRLQDGRWVQMTHPQRDEPWGYVTYQAAEYAFACLGLNPQTHCINS